MIHTQVLGISRIIVFSLIISFSFSYCNKERKLTDDEVYHRALNNNLVYSGSEIYLNHDKISRDSLIKLTANSGYFYSTDYYVNDKNDVVRINLRLSNHDDSLLIERINKRLQGICRFNLEFENLSCDSIILNEFDYLYGASNGSNSSDDLILISKKKRSNLPPKSC